jgi:RNase H-fold protein (predicted Holliday junction resolvase)
MDEELRGMRAASGGATALGVDYGMNRTGIAVSAGGIAPRPLEVVASKPIDALVREVVHRALKERVDVIVVGLPVPPNMTAAQAASARAPRRRKKSAEEKVIQSSSDGERLRARVDVATLASRRFRDASDLESWLGADGLKRELAKHRMKAGGTPRECSERLFSLIARRGVLNDVPARFFPGNARGKREAVRFAMEKRRTINRDDGVREDVTVLSEAGARKQKKKKKNSRPPREMHVLCRRFAERVADAAAALDVPIPVELYDESRTSLQAGLVVEASRGARGAAASLRPEASLDDVAAALLLERYFRKDRGPALPVKPMRGSRVLKAEGGETEDATPTENGVEEGSS